MALPAAGQSIQFESDQLQLEDKIGRVTLTGNVHAWNDTGWVKAERVEISYRKQGDTVEALEAFGNVRLKYPKVYGESDYAYRDVKADTILLEGNAYVKRRKDKFWADRIWVNLKTLEIRMNRDVRGSITPKSKVRTDE
ncbi:MAG: LptA/OstA family protein [bacterium]